MPRAAYPIRLKSFRREVVPTKNRSRAARGVVAVLGALVVLMAASPAAHEIPNDVRIQAFLKPEGQRLRLIVRAPIASMNDVAWPSRDGVMLDLADIGPLLDEGAKVWISDRIELYEGDRRLGPPRTEAIRVSLPSDTSFDAYDRAVAHLLAPPMPADTELAKNQAFLDVLFEYPIESDRSRFSVDPRFELLGIQTLTVLRLVLPDGAERAFQFHNDPGLVRLDPRWFQAAWRFVVEGFFHILDGIDHLLFLLCLVIPFRRFRTLVPIVTAFTIAHSITLIASSYDMAPDAGWFPPLVETLIAASIVYMALENIVAPGVARRWAIAFGFGLIHGFGFSFALRETLQLAGSHLLTALLSFNVGVELGQLVVLVLLVPALELLFRFVMAERVGTIILSALVAHTGWHWMTDRFGQLRLYTFEWPAFDAAFFASFVRWMMLLVFAAGVAWLMSIVLRPAPRSKDERRVRVEEA